MTDNLIRDITIDGFRAFEHFEMHDLGRVNLLVGKNNCGKSSVLEAIQIASSTHGDLSALWSVLAARGDVVWDEGSKFSQSTADISHLFHGFSAALGNRFRIEEKRCRSTELIDASVVKYDQKRAEPLQFRTPADHSHLRSLRIEWKLGTKTMEPKDFPIVRGHDLVWWPVVNANHLAERIVAPVVLVPTKGLESRQLGEYFDEIALTPSEENVITALNAIDERILRIAKLSTRSSLDSEAPKGFIVSLKGVKDRVPIGSLGDGVWRMLGLALALAKSANGILLIDEIDTGLHYSVMEKMWKLVYEGAKRLNVQVFATTHSRDCVGSLAAIASSDEFDGGGDDVTIQHIERDKKTAIAFIGDEIRMAAEREIEVR